MTGLSVVATGGRAGGASREPEGQGTGSPTLRNHVTDRKSGASALHDAQPRLDYMIHATTSGHADHAEAGEHERVGPGSGTAATLTASSTPFFR